jgi:hypothetical protein
MYSKQKGNFWRKGGKEGRKGEEWVRKGQREFWTSSIHLIYFFGKKKNLSLSLSLSLSLTQTQKKLQLSETWVGCGKKWDE